MSDPSAMPCSSQMDDMVSSNHTRRTSDRSDVSCHPTTFHGFPLLPAELRIRIWKLTITPRLVDLSLKPEKVNYARYGRNFPTSTTLVPATLHTCREARAELCIYYERILSKDSHMASEIEFPCGYHNATANIQQQRCYAWVNLEMDVIRIGNDWEYEYNEAVRTIAPRIQRVYFRPGKWSMPRQYYRHTASNHLGIQNLLNVLVTLKEVFVEPHWTATGYHEDIRSVKWPCGEDNTWIIDRKKKEVMLNVGEVSRVEKNAATNLGQVNEAEQDES